MDISYSKSEKVGHLVAALAKARKVFKVVPKSQTNPYYNSRYADLADLIEATKDGLSDNELAVLQLPTNHNGSGVQIDTLLIHSSDEWISSALTMPVQKADAQGIGSAITYGRRYGYGAILNLASEEDDDGNAATGKTQEARRSKSTENTGGLINPVQMEAWHSACKVGGRTDTQKADFLAEMGVELEQVPQASFPYIIKWGLNKITGNVQSELEKSVSIEAKRKKAKAEPVLVTNPELSQTGD